MKAIIVNSQNVKVKTITGTTNNNGYFWKIYNNYCNSKGYTTKIVDARYAGGLAWSNGIDVLQFKWIK